jgi:hypothetical protein
VQCGAVRCGAVRRGAVRCGAVQCGAVREVVPLTLARATGAISVCSGLGRGSSGKRNPQ